MVEVLNDTDEPQPFELVPAQSAKVENPEEQKYSHRSQTSQERNDEDGKYEEDLELATNTNDEKSDQIKEDQTETTAPISNLDQNRTGSVKKMPPNSQKRPSSRNVLKKYNESYFDSHSKQGKAESSLAKYSRKSAVGINAANKSTQQSKPLVPKIKDEQTILGNGSRLSEKKLQPQIPKYDAETDDNLIDSSNIQKHKSKLLSPIQSNDNNQALENLKQQQSDLQIEVHSQDGDKINANENGIHDDKNPNPSSFITPVAKLQRSSLLPKNFSESRRSLQTNRVSSSKPSNNQRTTDKNDLNFLKCNEVVRYSYCKTEAKGSTASKNLTSDVMFVAKPVRPGSFRKIDQPRVDISQILDPKKNPIPAKYNTVQSKPETIPLVPVQPNVAKQAPIDPVDLQKRPSSVKLVPAIEVQQLTDTQQKIEKLFSMNSKKVDPHTCFNSKRENSKNGLKERPSKLLDPRKADCARCDEKNTPVSWREPPELFKSKITEGFRQSANSIVAEYIKNPNIMKRYSEKKENVYNDDYKQMLMEKRQINELKVRQSKMKFLIDKEAAEKIKHEETDPTQMLEYNKEYVS